MTTSPDPTADVEHAHACDDPARLLELLRAIPDSVLVGFEPDGDHVDLHVRLLPDDERCAAAGLFGFEAPPAWTALGVAVSGRAERLSTREFVGEGIAAFVVVTRQGRCASVLDDRLDAEPGDEVTGLMVDALHRCLGLPSPGAPPEPASFVLALWSQRLAAAVAEHGTVEWEQALALHPGDPGPGTGRLAPSAETLVEATMRAAGFRWEGLHRMAIAGAHADAFRLRGDEAAWMDTTMFARWTLGSLSSPSLATMLLRTQGCDEVADRLRDVARAIEPDPFAERAGPYG